MALRLSLSAAQPHFPHVVLPSVNLFGTMAASRSPPPGHQVHDRAAHSAATIDLRDPSSGDSRTVVALSTP